MKTRHADGLEHLSPVEILSNPLQRAKRDVDIASGHVVFDYDLSRELAGALAIGVKISPIAMV
jgi:3-hydroxy-9,10-secoandrosta-1,3,5(10)-triene-9,17-dione monooxygenase